MKSFSDLRFGNTQVSDQLTALILVGVAAVIIGGVGHMGAQRRDTLIVEAAAPPLTIVTPALMADMPLVPETVSRDPVGPRIAPLALSSIAAMQPQAQAQTTAQAPATQQPLLKSFITAATQPTATPERLARTAELSNGSTLANLLADADLDDKEVQGVLKALGDVHNMRKLPRGLEVTLYFSKRDGDETFDGLTMQPDALTELNLRRLADSSFKAEKIATPMTRQRFAAVGTIRSTLYEAGAQQGVPRGVMASMIRAFSHEIDFQRDLHPGNKFRVFYDQPRTKSGQPVGDATIIYAALEMNGATKSVYRVLYEDGSAEYFNDTGESIRRGLMRTPIDGARMTSTFGMRRHPILGFSTMHKGIDFGAPTGTPILAAGDGTVQTAAYQNGFGRIVVIKHSNGLSTAYAHASRFARGLMPGNRVRQGDVIAYVGTTGRSTGPHLHFEVRVDNRQVNPMSVQNLQGSKALSGPSLVQFKSGKERIQAEFARLSTQQQPIASQPATQPPSAAQQPKKIQMASNNHDKPKQDPNDLR